MVRRKSGRVSEEDRQVDARVGDAHNAMVAQKILNSVQILKIVRQGSELRAIGHLAVY